MKLVIPTVRLVTDPPPRTVLVATLVPTSCSVNTNVLVPVLRTPSQSTDSVRCATLTALPVLMSVTTSVLHVNLLSSFSVTAVTNSVRQASSETLQLKPALRALMAVNLALVLETINVHLVKLICISPSRDAKNLVLRPITLLVMSTFVNGATTLVKLVLGTPFTSVRVVSVTCFSYLVTVSESVPLVTLLTPPQGHVTSVQIIAVLVLV